MSSRLIMASAIGSLLLLISVLSQPSGGEENRPTLVVIDRSMHKDGLYQCTLHLAADYPVDSMSLVLYDRKKSKNGEVLLASPIKSIHGNITFFFLNHELVKNSVLTLHTYPPDDERHTAVKFVIGERAAVKTESGQRVEVPIQ